MPLLEHPSVRSLCVACHYLIQHYSMLYITGLIIRDKPSATDWVHYTSERALAEPELTNHEVPSISHTYTSKSTLP